jgi:PAS domain S-box-containing protein
MKLVEALYKVRHPLTLFLVLTAFISLIVFFNPSTSPFDNFLVIRKYLEAEFSRHLPVLFSLSLIGLLFLLLVVWPRRLQEHDQLRQELLAHTSHTPLAMCIWDRNFKCLDWNDTATRLFGYTKEEAVGKTGSQLIIPPELKDSIKGLFAELVSDQGGFRNTNENITKDGRRIICDWYNTPIKNSKGEITAIISLALDVSERLRIAHEVQAALKKSREEQAALVHLATHRFVVEGRLNEALPVITESTARVLNVARCGVWLLSADKQELRSLDIYEAGSGQHTKGAILRAADYPGYFVALTQSRAIDAREAAKDPRTSEFADPYLRSLGITSMLDASIRVGGRVIGVVCNEHIGEPRNWSTSEVAFAADIADQIAQVLIVREREDALVALRQSEEMFRQLTDNIKGVFWLTSLDRKTVYYISKEVEEVWGRGAGLFYSDPQSWLESVHREDRKYVEEALSLQALGQYDVEFRIIRPDGEIRWVRDRAFPIKNAKDEIYRIAGICEDITAQKKAMLAQLEMESQLRQAQKMDALGRLAGGIAHDFNNILSSIIGYSQLLHEELIEAPQKQSLLDPVLMGAQRAKQLVKQILTFTRQAETKIELVRLSEVIEEVCKFIRITIPKNVSLVTELDPSVVVKGDSNQLYQVIMNLSANAIYAMRGQGGLLSISLVGIRASDAQSAKAILKVKDTGTGIPKEVQDRIFDPFFTTKPVGEGTGLGLSVVHGVVKAMNGTISVESNDGKGTEFALQFPLVTESLSRLSPPELIDSHQGKEIILLVDDEEMVRSLFSEVLKRNGYQVFLASDGKGALNILSQNRDIKLLISDLTMPGMNGLELINQALKTNPNMKTLLCSGYDTASTDLPLNVNARLTKPFSVQELLTAVRGVLNQERMHDNSPRLRLIGGSGK